MWSDCVTALPAFPNAAPIFANGASAGHSSCQLEAITRHFEGESVAIGPHPIPTRVLNHPANLDESVGTPRFIDLDAAGFSVAILLADPHLQNALGGPLRGLRQALAGAIPTQTARPLTGFCLPLVIALDAQSINPLQTERTLGIDGAIQSECAFDWGEEPSSRQGVVRILMHACRLILDGLLQLQSGEGASPAARRSVFFSHAKADLPEHQANSIVHGLAARMRDSNYGLDVYLDETHALPGWSWRIQFDRAIDGSAFIAFDGDSYPSRIECQRELLRAKRSRRPILAISMPHKGQSRSFAYGGNLPVVNVPRLDDASMDQLVLDIFTEMVRTELWLHEARDAAERKGIRQATLLPRPVELADLAFHVLNAESESPGPATLIYPDPPLPSHVRKLIDALRPPGVEVQALSGLG